MEKHDHHGSSRGSAAAALAGMIVAVAVAAIATVPAQWSIATLMLAVLAMPAILVVEPALRHLHRSERLPGTHQ